MSTALVSETFDPTRWREVDGFDFTDITYHRHVGPRPRSSGAAGDRTGTDTSRDEGTGGDAVADDRTRTDTAHPGTVDLPTGRIAFNRPELHNAFRPHTVDELYRALDHARMTG